MTPFKMLLAALILPTMIVTAVAVAVLIVMTMLS
jgi:hypothetical protein